MPRKQHPAPTQHSSSQLWLEGGAPAPGQLARARIRSAEDIRAVEVWPLEALLPERTLYGAISLSARIDPEKPAIVQMVTADTASPPRCLRYGEMMRMLHRAANCFHAMAEGEARVALILPLLPEALVGAWAAATAGIGCPVNPFLELRHVVAILNTARANILVVATNRWGTGAWDRVDDIRAQVPTLRHVLVVDGDEDAAHDTFHKTIAPYRADALDFVSAAAPDQDAMYLPTGGTTAAPKLVRLSHLGQLVVAWNSGAMADASRDGIVAQAMPNFHVGGAVHLALRAMLFGQTLLILTAEGFRNPQVVSRFWEMVRHYGVTAVTAAPATAAAILGTAQGNPEGHRLVTFNCGGSPVPMEVARAFHERFGVWLREVWGMSEFHGIVSGHPVGMPPRIGSVGTALPFARIKAIVVDAHNRYVRDCSPGERGTLIIGGATIMPGYADACLDGEFFIVGMPDGERWGNTGDLGTVDEEGYAWVFGRSKDMIIRGGHNIDPRMIEETLNAHPAVQVAAAIGRPDAMKGELPMAYVQPRPHDEVSSDALIAYCRERIPERAAVPVEIHMLAQMPVTAIGKVDKPRLRNDAMLRVAREVAASVARDAATSLGIELDESGVRPRVCIRVLSDAGQAEMADRLTRAFRNFEFITEVIHVHGTP